MIGQGIIILSKIVRVYIVKIRIVKAKSYVLDTEHIRGVG